MFPSLPVNQRNTSIKGYSQCSKNARFILVLLNNSKPDLALSFRDYHDMVRILLADTAEDVC